MVKITCDCCYKEIEGNTAPFIIDGIKDVCKDCTDLIDYWGEKQKAGSVFNQNILKKVSLIRSGDLKKEDKKEDIERETGYMDGHQWDSISYLINNR